MEKKKILIFTGAGVDKESGIETFRDTEDGLWNNHKIEDVATPDGWRRNKEKVLNFYNERRKQLKSVHPNLAHQIIADLEKDFYVTVVTQNVTDLHERAGSTKVIHLHGELTKSKSTFPGSYDTYDCVDDIKIGDKCERGSQLRHNICFFGENLNPKFIDQATEAAQECDICVIVGTSMQVSPANQIPFLTKTNTLIYVVDPAEMDFYIDKQRRPFLYHIKEVASVGMEKVKSEIEDVISNEK
jgi:NAD-dependent deacetylase